MFTSDSNLDRKESAQRVDSFVRGISLQVHYSTGSINRQELSEAATWLRAHYN